MPWPLSQDYNEAVQSPALSFADPELQQAQARCNAIGLPMPCSGNFADVYEMTGPGGKRWAVKCFTRQVPGLRERYAAISAYLKQVDLPFMVDFAYLDPGIKVRGLWYPVLKMEWVEGLALNEFVKQNADQPATLDALCQIWVKLAWRLRETRIAHADLQHGNVLLVPGKRDGALSVRLIDYDGMWVPALARSQSGEVGHPAYQHPRRLREGTYSAEVDRFPHLVIYTALRSLTVGSRYLWNKYDNGDNLLFRQVDLAAPGQSPLFRELIQLKDEGVRMLAQAVSIATNKPLEETPLLDTVASDRVAITPVRNRPRSSVAAPETVAADPLIHSSKRRRQRSPITAMLIGMVCFVGLVAGGWWLTDHFGSRSSNNRTAVAQRPPDRKKMAPASPRETSKGTNLEPAPKSKSDPETQPEAKPTPKPEPKPEPSPEPKPEPKPAPKPPAQPEPEPIPEPKPPAKPEPTPEPQPAPTIRKIYLTELNEFDVKVAPNKSWSLGKGTIGNSEGTRISVKGIASPHGLGMLPPKAGTSSVKYRMDKGVRTFQASVALDDSAKIHAQSPVTFTVLGDNKVLWTSKPIQAAGKVQECKLDITGRAVLELRATCTGGHKGAFAVWFEPHLLIQFAPLPKEPAAKSEGKQITNSIGIRFARVPAGTFWMGGGGGKPGNRQVTIPHDFYLGIYAVTQEQWQAVMGSNPSYFSRSEGGADPVKGISDADLKQFPVESVSWNDAKAFCDKLSELEKDTLGGWKYRLPTEAEWEYACRGGATSREECSFDFYFDRPTNDLSSNQANFHGNHPAGKAKKGPYLQRPTKVGSYAPNRLGLYDMHGNVWQWCEDAQGSDCVLQGGSWDYLGSGCRAANRAGRRAPSVRLYSLGFRLARVPSGG